MWLEGQSSSLEQPHGPQVCSVCKVIHTTSPRRPQGLTLSVTYECKSANKSHRISQIWVGPWKLGGGADWLSSQGRGAKGPPVLQYQTEQVNSTAL